ncbi:MAG: NPCBM/NEW2 domain-containing protein [Bacilli bacterium]
MKKPFVSSVLAFSLLATSVPLAEVRAFNGPSAQMTEQSIGTMIPFSPAQDAAFASYNAAFEVRDDAILAKNNNGGKYGSSVLDLAFDGNLDTHWETGKPNGSGFSNEVVVTFKEVETLDRLVYGARKSASNKGFAHRYQIYASTESTGNDFTLVTEGEYRGPREGYHEVHMPETAFKRLKFVFVEAKENWAAASELRFYRADRVKEAVDGLFTNALETELNPEYQTPGAVAELREASRNHPLSASFERKLKRAEAIIAGEVVNADRLFTPEQWGDMNAFSSSQLGFNYSSNLQPTGIYAVPGEKLQIFVETHGSSRVPQLAMTQHQGSWNKWIQTVQLKPGLNEIVVPNIHDASWSVQTPAGGPIYLVNPYTEAEQGKAPDIRIEGGTDFPLFQAGDSETDFLQELAAYEARRLNGEPLFNLFEITDEHLHLTGTSSGASEAYLKGSTKPSDTLEVWDEMMGLIFDNYGLTNDATIHSTPNLRENIRLMQPYGAMYAASSHIGVQNNVMAHMLVPERLKKGTWGLVHEIGHTMDMGVRTWGEVTNNMISQHINTTYLGVSGDRVKYNDEVYPTVAPDVRPGRGFNDLGYFGKLGMFWQLQLLDDDYWPELQRMYRERKPRPANELEKQSILVQYSSEVVGYDLSAYFDRYSFAFSDAVRAEMSARPKPEGKIWYLNTHARGYTGVGLPVKEEIISFDRAQLSADRTSANLSWSLVGSTYRDDVLGYEIVRDGSVVGFTTNTTFTDANVISGSNHQYQVVPVGKDLRPGTAASRTLGAPTLWSESRVVVPLNGSFDPLQYAHATSSTGEDLTDEITIVSNDVNVQARGTYRVTYQIGQGADAVIRNMRVEVVSGVNYASDLAPKSSKVGWGKLGVDKNPNGGAITLNYGGKPTGVAKGLGAHASSEIVYDVTGAGYTSFDARIGLEQLGVNSSGSVTFEVWVDGEQKYTSGRVNYADEAKAISIPIAGATEVKLITTDAGNGNGSDHSVWGDAKFIKQNTKPVLTVSGDLTVAAGTEHSLLDGVSAIDAEEGNMISKVVVTGSVDWGMPGSYPVTYVLTDSDGEQVSATRTIIVRGAHMVFGLSDLRWNSATTSFGSVQKDRASSGGTLRLTDETGAVRSFARGIGTHAHSEIVYNVKNSMYTRFTSWVGMDRAVFGQSGAVEFEVWTDGNRVWSSGVMRSTDPMKQVQVDLTNVSTLKLVVKDGGNGIHYDHANWAGAEVHRVIGY